MRPSFRWLIGEDVFVSYARADGLRYATALANELTRRGYACRIDQYDTLPGAEIPHHLRRSIRHCRMLVVVGSDRAAVSVRVGQEIAEFLERPRRGRLLLICFGEMPASATWHSLTQGLPLNREMPETLDEGKPSSSVIDLIANSFEFRRRNQRLSRVFVGLIAAIVLVIAIGSWGVYQVGGQLTRAVSERDHAAGESRSLRAETSKQRVQFQAQFQALTQERDRIVTDLGVQRAEASRQIAVNEALRSIGDAEVRRRSRGYSSARDVLGVLAGAATLRTAGRSAEAQAALAEILPLQPRLKAVIASGRGLGPVAVIADGRRLVVGGSPTRVWDLLAAREVASLPEQALSIATSANHARFLTVTRSGDFRVRDARSLEVVGQWACKVDGESPQFALSPDGSAALATCAGQVRLIDVATGAVKITVPQGGYVSQLRLGRPDGLIAVVNNVGEDMDRRLSLFTAAGGKPVKKGRCESPNRDYYVDPLAERVATGCDHLSLVGDSGLCAIDVCKTGAEKADFQLPLQGRATALFSSDGRRLATSEGGLVRVWAAADGKPLSNLGLRLPSRELRFSADGSHLAGQSDRLVWMTEASTGDPSLMIELAPEFDLLAMSGDGRVVVTGIREPGALHLWEAAFPRPAVIDFDGLATGVSFSPDGRYLIATGKKVRASDTLWFQVWDRTARAVVASLSDDTDREDGSRKANADKLAGYRNSGAGLSASTSAPMTNPGQPVPGIHSTYFAARGSTVIDARNGRVLFQADHPVLAVTRAGLAVTGEFGLIRIWRIATGELEARIRVRDNPAAVSFSPDEKEIAVAAGSRVETWLWRLDDLMHEACRLVSDNRAVAPWAALVADSKYFTACVANPRAR